MHIKSITLEGFKSYGNRVEITGFDPEFNAITGLNGTGKSNILDSICFVLGITNLSNVRAGSLQELIYKHGQAGITKATVSITFDNRDKRQCPIGYENHDEITVTRQVVMGGKNKYLINGINVQNKRVSDLFCSVQLNVNNPHFLIMQGRITKVLNMKPPEILSMVEEAAGTRMYEAKKQAAQKTIEKKDAKLRELNDIIKEDIAPKLQKLQDERSQFQEYQKVVREIENLTRLCVAWQYVTAEENAKVAEAKVSEVQDEIQNKNDQIAHNLEKAKKLDEQVAEMNKKLDEQSGDKLKELEAELTVLEKTESTEAAALKAAKEALSTHDKKVRLLEKALQDDEQALREKKKALEDLCESVSSIREAHEASEARVVAARERFLAVSTGLQTGDSLQEQLIAAKQEVSESSTIVSQSSMELKHCNERLKKLEKEFNSSAGQFKNDQQNITKHEAKINEMQIQLSRTGYSEASYAASQEQTRSLSRSVRSLQDRAGRLGARLQRTNCVYQDPERGFDRARVCGTVCRLINVRDPVFCTALETAAGGRLYNVVVDTEVTSKLLLERGKLQTRTTVIPLNKIRGQAIDKRTLATAQQIGGGPENVQLALDLISFEEHLRPAMTWVFGQTLVCKDLDTAKRVTFHPSVRKRCVTLDGDVFDPSGTISGGARVKGGSVLVEIAELQQLESELQRESAELARLESHAAAAAAARDQHEALMQRYEELSHELETIKSRVAATSHAQMHEEIQSLKVQAETLTANIETAKVKQKEAAKRAQELEVQVKDIKGHRDREFKSAEKELREAERQAEQHGARWRGREQEHDTLKLDADALQGAVDAGAVALTAGKEGRGELASNLEERQKAAASAQETVKQMQSKIKKHKSEIASRNTEISKYLQKKESLLKNNNELQLNIKELDYKIKELQTEAANCAKKITSLITSHPWIPEEKQYFGVSGGLYVFSDGRGAAAAGRLSALQSKKDRLQRGLNARAHTLLGKEEEQYQDLVRKKRIVEADRAKLVQVMAELDEKKRHTLVAAAAQVNRDFASIFSTLLPGAHAKLEPPPGCNVLDGLEVKVGFNGRWKESLGELSGGQRSLVALSLVLAMLLFKPAPLYILDEVDAALDLSHTQNIGHMLKEHFTHSQFIIVSLKDGMFNNANVLFRTKFVDGMSAVQRTVNNKR